MTIARNAHKTIGTNARTLTVSTDTLVSFLQFPIQFLYACINTCQQILSSELVIL